MSLGVGLVVGSFWLIAVAALLVGAVVWLQRGRRGLGLGLLAAGALLVVVPVGVGTWWYTTGYKQHAVWVNGLAPNLDNTFGVTFAHDRYFEDGDSYSFGNAGTTEQVVWWFQSEHPQGVNTTAAMAAGSQDQVSIWHISLDNIRYDLMGEHGSDSYTLQSQVAVVTPLDAEDPRVRIPFPVVEFGRGQQAEGVPVANSWSASSWHAFYEDITDATFAEDTITVPTNRRGTATIEFDDANGTFTITIKD